MARARRRSADPAKTWQQTKSENTRNGILDAAIRCFYEFGYNDTTTEKIATEAGVSRGAMLHHFPSRAELIRAAVGYLNQRRLELFLVEEDVVQSNAVHSRIEEGIDAYWAQLNTRYFVVFHELQVASRTDHDLAEVLIPAIQAFDASWFELVKEVFPDLAQSEAFIRANTLTLYLLEGLAANQHTRDTKRVAESLLTWLKGELRRAFADVLTTTNRASAKHLAAGKTKRTRHPAKK
ncbi:MAG: TetR/AcrR family transcriptional regulator [Gammaproteobacteria bacterium]|nr:TetR/AcrR family transcriptional regulator [Gammaproteobacteria bacterium]